METPEQARKRRERHPWGYEAQNAGRKQRQALKEQKAEFHPPESSPSSDPRKPEPCP